MTDASTSPSAFTSTPIAGARSAHGSLILLAAAEITARIVAFGTAAYLARRLGPELFGVFGFAAALCGYFGVVVGGGLSDVGGREAAQRPHAAARIYRSVLAVRIPFALAALASMLLFALWVPRPTAHKLIIAVSGLSLIAMAVEPLWVFRALQRHWAAAVGLVASQVVVLIAVLLLVTAPEHAFRVPLLQTGADLAVAASLVWLLSRSMSPRENIPGGTTLLRESLPLLFGRGMRAVIVSFDVVLLGFIAGAVDLGIYSAVYRLHFFVLALVTALQGTYLPLLARAATQDGDVVKRTTEEALSTAALVGAPVVAGGIVIAGPLLGFLFGPPYDQGARALQWLLISLALVFVHGLLHNVYVVTGRSHLQARWFALGAAVNVAANLWLIPRYGIAGAAGATALAEAIIAGGAVFVSRITTPDAVARAWAGPVAAALPMAAIVWWARDVLPVLASCALGAVLYAAFITAVWGRSRTRMQLRF